MTQMTQMTLDNLLQIGGNQKVDRLGFFEAEVTLPDGSVWIEKPSENGNGWFTNGGNTAGDALYIKKEV